MEDDFKPQGWQALENMHKAFLEALRHREQEILRYLAILGPALGGFIWLLTLDLGDKKMPTVFATGSLGVILLLLLGAVYSLSLGFNYRYITLQLAKLESDKILGIRTAMLKAWPRTAAEFLKRYRILWFVPWCTPPEIIKFFWMAFIAGIVGVMLVIGYCVLPGQQALAQNTVGATILPAGWVSLALSFVGFPIWFGWKIQKACKPEVGEW